MNVPPVPLACPPPCPRAPGARSMPTPKPLLKCPCPRAPLPMGGARGRARRMGGSPG